MSRVNKVGIIGAGTMGQGIAQVMALKDINVVLYDISKEQLSKAVKQIKNSLAKGVERNKITSSQSQNALNQIVLEQNLEMVKADLILEAAIEDLQVKQNIFSKIEEVNGEDTILATNTSSIPVTQIGNKLNNKNRFLGLHFFNPAHIMPLVEVVATPSTSSNIVSEAIEFISFLGKSPVLTKDSPGFIVNRVARHYYVESLKILEERVTDFETIDKLLEASGFRMGPFRLMDLIGVDTNYKVTETMYAQFGFDSKFRPSRIQRQLVDAGFNGKKSGKGFYDYES